MTASIADRLKDRSTDCFVKVDFFDLVILIERLRDR